MKTILIVLLVGMIFFSGCFNPPKPRFDAGGETAPKLDFNPLSFEALKLWNENSFTTQIVQLDACNTASRILDEGMYTWKITLNRC